MTRRIARDVGLLLASFALWFVSPDALEALLGESTAQTLVAWTPPSAA